jgi:hypothetical protein
MHALRIAGAHAGWRLDLSRLLTLALLGAALALGGCASTRPMAYGPDPASVKDATKQPIYLMTITVKNPYKTYYLPSLKRVFVERGDGKAEGDKFGFAPDEPAMNEMNTDADGNRYFVRLPLDAGKAHRVPLVFFMASKFPVNGMFYLPLNAELPAAEPGVYYLGHVEASVRERRDNEFRAGAVIPLLDQSLTGASGGTWDVTTSDRWDSDEALFRQRFPALGTTAVRKAVLLPFDRARAQREWDNPK